MLDRYPGSSATSSVTVSADNRSLAMRHSSRSRASDPTAAVPAGSTRPAVAMPSSDMMEQRLIDLVAGEFRVAGGLGDRFECRRGVGQRNAGAATAEIQQRHHTAADQTGIGVQRGQRRHGIGDSRAGCRWGSRVVRNAARSAHRSRVPNAPARQWRSARTARRRPRRPSRPAPRPAAGRRDATTRRPPPAEPGRRRARRSRSASRPVRRCCPCADGAPTSGARWLNRVSTDRRVTG